MLSLKLTFAPHICIIESIKVNREKRIFGGTTETIMKIAKENNGIVFTAMMVAAGFSRENIK